MKSIRLRTPIFPAPCCDPGPFSKRLIVFGDSNSKRSVSDVASLSVR